MILLGYIGDPKTSSVGWRLIRWAQRHYTAPARHITHTELLLAGDAQSATIASSSLVDDDGDGRGGVRIKHGVVLNIANWRVMQIPDTPTRNTDAAALWFAAHVGQPYDSRGAAGSVGQALVQQKDGEWFCSESCGAAWGLADPHMLCPAALWNLGFALGGVDITEDFFGITEAARWD